MKIKYTREEALSLIVDHVEEHYPDHDITAEWTGSGGVKIEVISPLDIDIAGWSTLP